VAAWLGFSTLVCCQICHTSFNQKFTWWVFSPPLPSLFLVPLLFTFFPFPLYSPLEMAPQIQLRDLGSAVISLPAGEKTFAAIRHVPLALNTPKIRLQLSCKCGYMSVLGAKLLLVFYDCHYWVLLKMFFTIARTLHEHYTLYSQSDKRIREVMIEDSTTENQVNSVVKALSTQYPRKIRGPPTQCGSFVKPQPIFEIPFPLQRLLNFNFTL